LPYSNRLCHLTCVAIVVVDSVLPALVLNREGRSPLPAFFVLEQTPRPVWAERKCKQLASSVIRRQPNVDSLLARRS
jgi:hypothetical protein